MKKRKFAVLACVLSLSMMTSALTACSNSSGLGTASGGASSGASSSASSGASSASGKFTPSGDVDKNIQAKLTLAAWDSTAIAQYDSLNLESRFQKYYPNVTIDIEQSKDDSEYWQSMQIRASANQLPDIMFNKPFTLSRYQNYLVDLTNSLVPQIAQNTQANDYALNGKVFGLPEKSVGDYVYYWKDMFKEAGVEVPTTWSDFVNVCKKLQKYYGAKKKDYSAIAIGAKDEWPTYSYTEFMPPLISGNGNNWDTMATQDSPFAKGSDINKAYHKVYDLFSAGVCGKDPLGIGQDQAVGLFGQKKASIMASGPWCLTNIKQQTTDTSNLSTFYLPVRNSKSDKFYTIAQGDCFMGVTKQSKNSKLALDFVRFYFSSDWYPDYIKAIGDDSTMKNFPKQKDPVLKAADEAQPDAVKVMYSGGGDNFQKIQSAVKFDYKKLGSQMFVSGFNLDTTLSKLNSDWAAARKSLGVKK